MNDSNFVETRAAKHVLERLTEKNCVTVTASSGVGKTSTIRHVALEMEDKGYDILLVSSPFDIVKFHSPNKKTLFVIDDFCGTYTINRPYLDNWETVLDRIKVLIQNKLTKIIVSCRLQVYKDEKFASLSIFRTCVCNLQSDDLCLLQTEKQLIAELYLGTKASTIIQYCDLYECFPLLCKLYSDSTGLNISDFFKDPFSVYEAEIEKLHKVDCGKYCALALCVMFNNAFEEELFTGDIDKETRKRIKNICEECKLERGTSRLLLLDEVKTLEQSFLKKEKNVYKAIHDKVFDFLVYYFGQKMIPCLIKNADSVVIMQRFLLDKTDGKDEFITVLPHKYHEKYIQRMIEDWSRGRVQCVFRNINMNVPEFRQRFLCHIKTLKITTQRQLALMCDNDHKDTVLFHCCAYDTVSFIQWCIDHGVDVNQCNCKNGTPMFVSAREGHKEVVMLLLQNKADINKCSDKGVSPLMVACFHNNLEIIKILLENNANINMRDGNGLSSLFIACQNNHIDVVKTLLDNKVDIENCNLFGISPLGVACQLNHPKIVNLLLQNRADINRFLDNGVSPLMVPCLKNDKEIVKKLLKNNAAFRFRAGNGFFPLFIACQNNHIEIVEILLDNKADIDNCIHNGMSSLYVASQLNHTAIVNYLLDYKADIDKCQNDGASPLFVACYNNHVETVKILLNHKAGINICRGDGLSPLAITCQMEHIETVKILLDDKAEISVSNLNPWLCTSNVNNIYKLLRKRSISPESISGLFSNSSSWLAREKAEDTKGTVKKGTCWHSYFDLYMKKNNAIAN
ncbi:Hypothetical predicted protein [Mytilus galloprovincialis]|uniref:Novel STAND NTPase 3 domain-containing protein n=1 Tax=Mytilus galloprovincialis TaxID=29158 RepID=A0A8B6H3T0_MYTGA|nr:Hypothetical predicted protein [Mytilus galloprovincialis]